MPSIDELIAAGEHAQAAERARDSGDFERAAGLYERIWAFAEAAACARAAGDTARALQNAIDARDEALVVELTRALDGAGEAGLRAAMEVFRRRRRFGDAGARAEAIGEIEAAIDDYRQGHHELEAARLLVQIGRDREAGRLLERMIKVAGSGREQAQARLQLGMLLVRRMQFGPAAEHLQEAAREPALRQQAQRPLIVSLAAMGLRDAAREVLVQARRDQPSLPAELDAFLRAERDADWTRAERESGAGDGESAAAGPGAGRASAVRAEPAVQVVGGRYRLERLLGAGGTGRVFCAYDEVSERRVAVKVFSLSRDHQAYERFVREARVTGRLRHDNLVEIYDFSAEQGYLVMEYLSGGSLDDRLSGPADSGDGVGAERGLGATGAARDGDDGGDTADDDGAQREPQALRERTVKTLALDVLAGLELAHRRGIIHRDIKPANIFFDARGTAKLGDFGVAHLLDLGQTQTGGLIGTLAYMAPEQITGAPLTIAADLYALGVTLYQALTGRLPLLGPDFIAQHLGQVPPLASAVASAAIQPGWDPILARLLAKSPSERYDDVDSLRVDLNQLQLGDGVKPLLLHRPAPSSATAGAASGDAILDSLVDIDRGADHAADDSDLAGELAGEPAAERYQFATPIGQTPISRLVRAVDTTLDRSVVIERYHEGAIDEATERRLYALARGGSPFLQWALAYDRESGVAVFEAPSGEPIAEALADTALSPRAAIRLLKRLARAVAPLHERGVAHGAIGPTTIVLDEQRHPTVILSGLGPAPADEPHPRADVAAILGLVVDIVAASAPEPDGGPDALTYSPEALAERLTRALVPDLSPAECAPILAHADAETGEALFELAEALELALLQRAADAA